MITEREKFLMREAVNSAGYYKDLDTWLNESVTEEGLTVAHSLSFNADAFAALVKSKKLREDL